MIFAITELKNKLDELKKDLEVRMSEHERIVAELARCENGIRLREEVIEDIEHTIAHLEKGA